MRCQCKALIPFRVRTSLLFSFIGGSLTGRVHLGHTHKHPFTSALSQDADCSGKNLPQCFASTIRVAKLKSTRFFASLEGAVACQRFFENISPPIPHKHKQSECFRLKDLARRCGSHFSACASQQAPCASIAGGRSRNSKPCKKHM